jgi:quinol monooxygenase YgiN
MDIKQLLLTASVLVASIPGLAAAADDMQRLYVQEAEIEIDPAQLEAYKAAVTEQIETATRVEPGVLVLYAVSEKDNPARVRVFEIYRDADAYRSHLETAHFKKYKTTTEKMVRSLKLIQTTPILLGTKAR